MNRLYRGTLEVAADCMAALMSRLDRTLGPGAFLAANGPGAFSALDHHFAAGLRILVVDDNPSNLGDACELLGCWGITPTLAADGVEAVALACSGHFDLILMDLQMPVLDGLRATRQIRAYEHQQSCLPTPVLAYTTCVLAAKVLRDCSLDGVLEKPCSASALEMCLLRWCTPASGDFETETPAGAWFRDRPADAPLRSPRIAGATANERP